MDNAKPDHEATANHMEALIPATEAARLLHCHPRQVKAYAERGEIPAMKMGNRWMFLPSMLDEWRRKKLLANFGKAVTCSSS